MYRIHNNSYYTSLSYYFSVLIYSIISCNTSVFHRTPCHLYYHLSHYVLLRLNKRCYFCVFDQDIRLPFQYQYSLYPRHILFGNIPWDSGHQIYRFFLEITTFLIPAIIWKMSIYSAHYKLWEVHVCYLLWNACHICEWYVSSSLSISTLQRELWFCFVHFHNIYFYI